jgi:hypothetical protein
MTDQEYLMHTPFITNRDYLDVNTGIFIPKGLWPIVLDLRTEPVLNHFSVYVEREMAYCDVHGKRCSIPRNNLTRIHKQ